jgi:predicted O-linked N-acetylglucosamine transferase (SPINDLY family)
MTLDPSSQQSVPQTIAQLLQQAIAHHQSGQLLQAGELYQTILQSQPNHPEVNFNLGVIAVQVQQPAAGLPYFMAALDADPTCGKYWLNYIDALFQAGQPEEARAVLELARQQGLQGDAVNALAARLGGGAHAAEQSSSVQQPIEEAPPVSPMAPQKGGSPSHLEMDALVMLFSEGRYTEVATLAQRMTERFPLHEFGWKILGVVLKLLGRGLDALEPMRNAAALSPGDVETRYNLGVTLQELGRLDEAVASYRRALQINPDYADACLNLGVTLNKLGRLDEAAESLERALQINPDYAEAHSNLGATLQELGRLDEAEACYRRALEIQPGHAMGHNNLGITLQRLGHPDEAEACYRRALEISPDYAEALSNLGSLLQEAGRLDEAEASFSHALRIRPDDAKTHNNLGITLQEQGRLGEADAHFQMALQINPNDARTHDNRGHLLCHQGRLNEAETCYRKALQLAPDDARIHANLGKCLRYMGRLDEAETRFRQALEIRPDDVNTHNNLGLTLQELGRLDQAVACYRTVLQTKPDNAGVMSNLGQVYQNLGQLDEAEACFRQALQSKPDHASLHSNLLYFLLLSAKVDTQSVVAEHARFGQQFETSLRPLWPKHANARDPERCLQIGFVSADLYNHAVASFLEPVLVHLSGYPQLSLHAYYNHFVNDEVTQRLRSHFAHWNPVAGLSDAALVDKIRADGIDILIDLTGHSANNRLLTFARKPAPVQASWFGYPATTGLSAVDYYFADRFLLPPGEFDDQFTEKIVRLPANATFLPSEFAPPVNALPALSKGYVTFGSFNRPNKLSREVIALWSRLLRALPDSRMLLGGMPEAGHYDTLIAWFEEEGIAQSRLDFHPRSGMEQYLALHHQIDICLDTFPYNGGTTTHHALWMGVPTLTLAGVSLPGRVGVAILAQAGLLEFAVKDADDFVARGVYWSQHIVELDSLRSGLREQLQQSPPRKPEIIAAGLERALRTMWRRWCEGLPAESFEVHLRDVTSAIQDTNT